MPRSSFARRIAGVVGALGVIAGVSVAVPAESSAAPAGPPLPVEFDLSRYRPVEPTIFRSIAFEDNGRSFFTTGRWFCQIGPQYRNVGCQGRPATAPHDSQGAIIVGDQQGPWFLVPGLLGPNNYRFGSRTGFRAPVLGVGTRVTIAGVTCTVPNATTVACRTGERALIFTPRWHKFFYPSWDTVRPGYTVAVHSNNPAPQYLPPRLRYWNQLPANPPAPK